MQLRACFLVQVVTALLLLLCLLTRKKAILLLVAIAPHSVLVVCVSICCWLVECWWSMHKVLGNTAL